MEQVAMFLAGERDYTLIKGGTGPLVYPAAHVYIYSALYYITDSGRNILLAQIIFVGVYLASLSVVMACYRLAKVGILLPTLWEYFMHCDLPLPTKQKGSFLFCFFFFCCG